MGHIRLGDLPRTRKWQEVVAFIEGGAGTAQVANARIFAAENRGMQGKMIAVPRGPANANRTRRSE
jgi:alkaline phosphatase